MTELLVVLSSHDNECESDDNFMGSYLSGSVNVCMARLLYLLSISESAYFSSFLYIIFIYQSVLYLFFVTQGIFLKSFVNTTVEESCLFREKLNVNEEPPWDPS